MLTRLKVQGFKNLIDFDMRFGPITCIAGPNGVGKSNIFDAIQFLSSLMDETLLEAATRVRQDTSSANASSIFSRGRYSYIPEIRMEADMIVPKIVRDDLDQDAIPSTTTLRYNVAIRLREKDFSSIPRLELIEEKLTHIKRSEMLRNIPYTKQHESWRKSVLIGKREKPLISTDIDSGPVLIKVHQDKHGGRTQSRRADSLPRTVLSTINNAENPTALAARREMQSWRLLQLEPSRLRTSDEMSATPYLEFDGKHLAATLNRLLNSSEKNSDSLRARIANRLSALIDDVQDVNIERDDKRELLTVLVSGKDNIWFRARDLSDGTLRFLALSVLEADTSWGGLICMEEPENGIHPSRISAMLQLLESLAVDPTLAADDTNPLRQVIFNTHSPDVVGLMNTDSVLFAVLTNFSKPEGRFRGIACRPLWETWRLKKGDIPISKGEILRFLKALPLALNDDYYRKYSRPVASCPELFEQLSLFPKD